MSWKDCKHILCIRPDNMGDLIMTGPAIRALKQSFGAKITMLTSSMAQGIIKHIADIDDTIIFDVPWVKTDHDAKPEIFNEVVEYIKAQNFDAAVIFTVYSQNPLPTAMLAYLAGIPKILSYCRENPYQLISDWVPDKEPYEFIKHQVRRDLDMVATLGAFTEDENLHLQTDERLWPAINAKLKKLGIITDSPWLILHAGVSEAKRTYPPEKWVEAAQKLIDDAGYQILLTGSALEKNLTDILTEQIGERSFSIAGLFNLEEFICLVKHAPIMLSVNTGAVHIAAATGTPVVVLYAQTNPQHTPWKVAHKVLPFPVLDDLKSRNEIVKYVCNTVYEAATKLPTANEIFNAVTELLNGRSLTDQSGSETHLQNLVTITN